MRQMGMPSRSPAQEGPRINDRIKALEVRLIDADGAQVGIVPLREALAKADELGLDLVEVSPDAKPPVCKIIDFGKFKYEQSKKANEAKKKQSVIEVKEVQLTPNTDKHDIETKQNHIRKWVTDKNRVRVFVRFRGREMSHMEVGYKTLQDLLAGLEDVVVQESHPRLEGRRLAVTLLPKEGKEKA